MLETHAPLLAACWSQILALVVGVIIANVFPYFVGTGGRRSDGRSAASPSSVRASPVTKNNVNGRHAPSTKETERSVEEQAQLESCEPSSLDNDKEGDSLDLDWEKWASEGRHISYTSPRYTTQVMVERSYNFYSEMNNRRSLRYFSDDPVPQEVIDNVIRTAGTAPSGAHTEPWRFVAVKSSELKTEIRHLIEAEEKINYEKRMGPTWVNDLKAVGTTWKKPYIETAPYIIIVFKQTYGVRADGSRQTNYYHEISVSISVGLLLAAIQNAGLVTLTSTPMNAGPKLRALLDRPSNEKVLLLLPVGFPAKDATVPDFKRKPIEEILFVK